MEKANRITLDDLGREPFRVFFPEGVFAGILGVALWPLYFTGVSSFYPGQAHARIMAYGLFGGFIFGFLGTAMPRMLS
ncbi:MAG TPA: NnrS family protein, partial [Candidatus Angelobacter sp.]